MIRIDLLPRRKRWPAAGLGLIAAAVLAIAAGAAGLYWVDQHYPLLGAWRGLWTPAEEEAAHEPSAVYEEVNGIQGEAESQIEAPAAVEEETSPPVAMEEESMSSVVEDEPEPTGPAVEEGEAMAAEPAAAPPAIQESLPQAKTGLQVAAVDTGTGGERRSALRESAACLWVLQVTARLPSSARLTSLTCKASGEYSLEGVGSSDRDVEGFVETLQQLPSQVDLTLWREGRLQTNRAYRFAFHGQFEELFLRDLEAMSAAQARTLAEKIGEWARQSGLDKVSLKGPIDVPLDKGHAQRRHKLWATGSQAQIGSFLRQLKQVKDIATLGEVVIVPVRPEDEGRGLARLYAAVDLLVRQP